MIWEQWSFKKLFQLLITLRGLEAVSEEEKDSAFVKGIEQIYKQFVAVMEDVGVTQWMRRKKFDANLITQ